MCFERAHNRFKVKTKGGPPQYTLMKWWAKLVKQGGTVFAMEAALAEASASLLEKCGTGEQVASGGEKAPGDSGDQHSDAEQSDIA